PVHAQQPEGPARRALGAQRRLPPLVQSRPRHRHPPHPRRPQDRRPAAHPERHRAVSQPFRLPTGGQIDRGRLLRFTFDAQEYEGHPGDTLASALLANGLRLVARSFKYHRPRGIFTAGAEEPSALVQLESGGFSEPNRRATDIALYDGLNAASQHACPRLGVDLGALVGGFAPLFPAGFYYKTFMQPRALWRHLWEPLLRRMAGLGRAPALPDPSRYDKCHIHCDVLVVGAGPAGLAAALAAGRSGARV